MWSLDLCCHTSHLISSKVSPCKPCFNISVPMTGAVLLTWLWTVTTGIPTTTHEWCRIRCWEDVPFRFFLFTVSYRASGVLSSPCLNYFCELIETFPLWFWRSSRDYLQCLAHPWCCFGIVAALSLSGMMTLRPFFGFYPAISCKMSCWMLAIILLLLGVGFNSHLFQLSWIPRMPADSVLFVCHPTLTLSCNIFTPLIHVLFPVRRVYERGGNIFTPFLARLPT